MEREPIDWKARGYRRRANIVALVEREDGRSFRALLPDISYAGCHMLSKQALERGETLSLTLRGKGVIKAQVRWVSGDKAGLRFLFEGSAFEERRARLGV